MYWKYICDYGVEKVYKPKKLLKNLDGWKHNKKKNKGVKLKVLFQGLYMACIVFVLVYNFKFYILGTSFNTKL
jgi:hypothetical protein